MNVKILATAAFMAVFLVGCTNANVTTENMASPSPVADVDNQLDSTDVQEGQDVADRAAQNGQDSLNQLAKVKTVTLQTQSNSGQSGTAVLTEMDDSTVKVVLNLKGGSFTQPQPAHIHLGSCPTPGAVKYPLTNVVSGQSETTLNVNMDTLLAAGDELAINVHKSAGEQSVYTACGDLK